MSVPPPKILEKSELPLVLLAAVGHPDPTLRRRLASRLDQGIEARRPFFPEKQVQEFLLRHRTHISGPARQVALRVLRLVFAGGAAGNSGRWLRIDSGEKLDDERGLLVTPKLKVHYLKSAAFTHYRQKQRQWGASLLAGAINTRLAGTEQARPVRAVCSLAGGYCLKVTGELPWEHPRDLLRISSLGSATRLRNLGFSTERRRDGLIFLATTAEATLRFSACLVRGESLVLRDVWNQTSRVVVQLRAFEGESAEFPVVASYHGKETWLHGVPSPAITLESEDRQAITSWLYSSGPWPSNEQGEPSRE